MREAFRNTVVGQANIDPEIYDNLDWPFIFESTKGSSERELVYVVLNALHIDHEVHNGMFQTFIAERSRLINQFNARRGLKKFDETEVFEDFLTLTRNLNNDETHDTLFFLVTGNPSFVMKDISCCFYSKYTR